MKNSRGRYIFIPIMGAVVIMALVVILVLGQWFLENWDFCGTQQEIKLVLNERVSLSSNHLEVITPENLTRLMPLVTIEGMRQPRLSVAFDPEGKRLAIGGTNVVPKVSNNVHCGSVWVYNLETAVIMRLALQSEEIPRGFSFSPDGKLLAFVNSGRLKNQSAAIIWNMATNESVSILKDDGLCGLAFDPTSSELHIFTETGQMYVWDSGSSTSQDVQESDLAGNSACETPLKYISDVSVTIIPNSPASGYVEFLDSKTEESFSYSLNLYDFLPQFTERTVEFGIDGKSSDLEYIPLNEAVFNADGTLLAIAIGNPWAWEGNGAVQIWGVPAGNG
ncbi:MAG: hypothetical protein H6672_10015 [Anaerolineaceae bacterium]|nr:hypothetical protein [Anaerolineaceae bacterium]